LHSRPVEASQPAETLHHNDGASIMAVVSVASMVTMPVRFSLQH